MIATVAPAKINWTLEVLGKRGDGYHEVRTVLQTIDLHDQLTFERAAGLSLVTRPPGRAVADNLVLRTATVLSVEGANVTLEKRIPAAAGLGGGSSDAAATIRALNELCELGLDERRQQEVAATLGSDVPFFLRGGTAAGEGKGERLSPLPDGPVAWLVVVVPPRNVPDKTRRMYAALRPEAYSDGSRTTALVEHLRRGGPVEESLMFNAFEDAAFEMFEGLGKYRDWLIAAGARAAHLCGAGPALFALTSGEAEARAIRSRMNRPKQGEKVFVARTIPAPEATLSWQP